MPLLRNTIIRPVGRLGAAAQNALEVARFGGLETDERALAVRARGRAPRLSAAPLLPRPRTRRTTGAARAAADARRRGLRRGAGHQRGHVLRDAGARIPGWWTSGRPSARTAGSSARSPTTCSRSPTRSTACARRPARDVHLAGYSQGGMFCYQAAAYRRTTAWASLITFGSPVDTRAGDAVRAPRAARGRRSPTCWPTRSVAGRSPPGPVAPASGCSIPSRRCAAGRVHPAAARPPGAAAARGPAPVPRRPTAGWPGRVPRWRSSCSQFIAHNRMLEGGFVIDDRLAHARRHRVPDPVGRRNRRRDRAGGRRPRHPPRRAAGRGLRAGAAGRALRPRRRIDGQRGDLADGRGLDALARRRGRAARRRYGEVGAPPAPRQVRNRVGYAIELTAAVGGGIARGRARDRPAHGAQLRELAREAVGQLPRLARLEQIQPGTRISLGLLVDERNRGAPDEMFFLFEDRAYTARQVDDRIDNVVRGLISIGVRQGEHVGVLMGTRPSALALAVALSRLGAGGRTAAARRRARARGRARAGAADHRRPRARAAGAGDGEVHTFVLGGGGGPREFDVALVDRHGADRPRRGHAAALVPPEPGRAARPGIHPVHRRGRGPG